VRVFALAAIAFASTNIDDIFVLIGFFSSRSLGRASVVAGQYLGIAALTVTAIACSLLTIALPDQYIRYLGILPMLIGAWHLTKRILKSDSEAASPSKGSAGGTVLSVATVTVANGSDNIAAYVPLFGHQPPSDIAVTCIVFGIMTGIWCAAGIGLLSYPRTGAVIRRWGDWIMPLVLIGLGAAILLGA